MQILYKERFEIHYYQPWRSSLHVLSHGFNQQHLIHHVVQRYTPQLVQLHTVIENGS
jgi:hypothetical protein